MEGNPDPVCFYEVLGLGRGCTADQIKRAYRRLAVLYHPDKNIGNEESNAHKFKLIAEAYEVLSDDEKRRAYDRWGRAGVAAHESGAQPHTASAGAAITPPLMSRAHGFEEDFGLQHAREIFQAFFGGQDPFMHHHQHHQQRGAGPGMMGFGAFPGFGFGEDEEEDDFFGGPGFGLTSSLFGGGGGGGGGGIFGRSSPLFDSPSAFFSPPSGFGAHATSAGGASSTTHTVNSGGGGSTRSVRRIVRIGLDGTRRTRKETTVVHADGRREVQVEEEEEQQEQRLEASPSTPALEQRAHRHGHGHGPGHGHHHGHH